MPHTTDSALPVDAVLEIIDAEQGDWNTSCDVLVVGLGAAGAASAITAKEAGLDVHVVDRFGMGGATAKSGGVVYAGGGTRQQKQAGYDDTPEAMFAYLQLEAGDAVKPATLRRFCQDSRELINWLESLGASFDSTPPPPKTSYPPNGTYLYFSGNESVLPFADTATPAPRGHRTVDSGLSGKKLFRVLRARVDALNIPVQTQSAVRRLITHTETGEVLGAEVWQMPPGAPAAKKHERLIRWADTIHNVAPDIADRLRLRAHTLEIEHAQPQRVRARRGVVLASGGFIFNREMLAQHAPKFLENMRIGTTGCDGSGIRLGQSAGGSVARLNKISAWRFINPPQAWAKGMVVNAQGQRFCNEAAYGARLGVAMGEDQGNRAWLVIDAGIRRAALRECLRGGLWSFQKYPALLLMLFAPRAKSFSALGKRLGIPKDAFAATADAYNDIANGDNPDVFGKAPYASQALIQPPYLALDIGAKNPLFPCPAITLGGLRVDETSGGVLNSDEQVIPGLYAVGRAAVGIASNNYVSGLSLADCLWSGRRAGAAIAATAEPTQNNVT